MVTHSSILSWENPWTEQPGSLPSGSAVKHLPAMQETRGSIPGSGRSPGGRHRQPTPVLLSGESHGLRSLPATVHRITESHKELK